MRQTWEDHPGTLVLTGLLATFALATVLLGLVGLPAGPWPLDIDGLVLVGSVHVLLLAPWCLPALALAVVLVVVQRWQRLSGSVRLGTVAVLTVAVLAMLMAWSPAWDAMRVWLLD